MKFKLVIGDRVDVPVKVSINTAAGKAQTFAFTLEARRMDVAEYREALGESSQTTVVEFLQANVTGWRGQRLVLDDDDQPAEWSQEAFGAMLGIVGMEQACFAAYIKALNLAETEAGKRGN
jgi:hypothetical protein